MGSIRVASKWIRSVVAEVVKTALKQKKLKTLLGKEGSFGMISAYSGKNSKSVNQQNHGLLMRDLQKLGYKPETIQGEWDNKTEKSYLVPNIDPKHLFDLGKKYNQDATIYKSKDGVVGMYYPKDKKAEIAVDPETITPAAKISDAKDLYSKTRNWSMELGFLWGRGLPWDGNEPLSRKAVKKHLSKAVEESTGGDDSSASTEEKKETAPEPKKDFDAFLKEKYQGGKARVQNPNPVTRKIYPEVAVSTALKKDKKFRNKLEQEFHAWAK